MEPSLQINWKIKKGEIVSFCKRNPAPASNTDCYGPDWPELVPGDITLHQFHPIKNMHFNSQCFSQRWLHQTLDAEPDDFPFLRDSLLGFAHPGSNGHVTYGGVTEEGFVINPVTGVITTTRELDREAQDRYTLTGMLGKRQH